MKPWFSRPGFWRRDARWASLRARLGLAGVALANLLFESIVGWCTEERTTTIPRSTVDQEARAWGIAPATRDRCLEQLVECDLLLASSDGSAFALVDEKEMIGRPGAAPASQDDAAPASAPRESRQGRYRREHADEVKAKDRARKASRSVAGSVTERSGTASRKASRNVTESVTPSTTPVAESADSVTFRDTPSPPDPPPTPAQAQAQAQAHEGAPGGPASPPGVGEENQQESPPSQAPEAASPPAAAAPKAKPRKPRALPARSALAAAYAAGVSAATGAPCSPPSARWDLTALEAMAQVHAAGRVGAELLGWLTEQGRDFAIAKAGDRFLAGKGYTPEACRGWLDGGAVDRPAPPKAPGPPPASSGPHPRREGQPTAPPVAATPQTPRSFAAYAGQLFAPKPNRTVSPEARALALAKLSAVSLPPDSEAAR